ncbi:MAG TPA: hypothetical protein VER03_15705 [Bryobacteraceae bacterium]|nr:hypothetical protein [Bryobacteraceae bacterium]
MRHVARVDTVSTRVHNALSVKWGTPYLEKHNIKAGKPWRSELTPADLTDVNLGKDEQGRTRGSAQFKLKDSNRAARPGEFEYAYVTGKAIGLGGGLEVVQPRGAPKAGHIG